MANSMSSDLPIEIQQLRPSLHELFTGKLPESTSGSEEEKERNFLSRALGAYSIHKLAGASIEESVSSVVDAGGDGGIDCIFYAATSQTLWVVQSKFIADGRGEPSLADVTKFKTGLENLLQGNFAAFKDNSYWQKIIPRLEIIFKVSSLQVRAVLIYSGTAVVSSDRRALFLELKRRFSPESDYFGHQTYNLTSVHDWITGTDQGPGVEKLELVLIKPGWVTGPYETVFGLVSLTDLARLYGQYGKRLIAANIRGFRGTTDVNLEIITTAKDEPANFFYLNNGLTAYCERLEVHNLDRANAESKRVTAYALSIVNGAQTLGSVGEALAPTNIGHDGFVFLKIISLERCDNDREFAGRITRSTNFQNQIGPKDFAAQQPEQEHIAKQLRLSGITYHYKPAEDVPSPDATNFTMDEATTAGACLTQQNDCDLYARALANRQSLLSMDEIFPEEPFRSRYSRVFVFDRSGRTVWRAVQTQRLVIRTMQDSGSASTGVRKTFFENARWLVLNAVYLKLRPEQGDTLGLTPDEEVAITKAALDFAEMLFSASEAKGFVSRRTDTASGMDVYEQPRHFRSVFATSADCQILRNELLKRINEGSSPASESTTVTI